jgi:hypothetical protein
MGLFAFNRARRLAAEANVKSKRPEVKTKSSGLDEYRELKRQAKALGIEIPKGTKADGIKELIEKAGEQNE